MTLKKIINKEFFFFMIITFVIFIFIKNISFFKNLYLVAISDFDKRMINKTYDYCGKSSVGYIYDITKKFNITNNPKVINFNVEADPSWVFLNTSKPKSDKYVILLNFIENPIIFFQKKKKFFIGQTALNAAGIKEIQFLSKYNKPIKINGNLQLYKVQVGTINFKNFDELGKNNLKPKEIYKLDLNDNNYINSKYIVGKEIPNFVDRDSLNLIKIFDNQDHKVKEIDKIKVTLLNQISLNSYQILDSYKNKCFYLKKNG